MDKLLIHCLQRLGLSEKQAPSLAQWQRLLACLSETQHPPTKQANKLAASLKQLAPLLQSMNIGIAAFDHQGHICFINREALAFLELNHAPKHINKLEHAFLSHYEPAAATPSFDKRKLSALDDTAPIEGRCLAKKRKKLALEWKLCLHQTGPQPIFILLLTDISERIQLEEHLSQVQKLEAMGALAGGVAHDFNNILSGMLGNITLIRKQYQWLPDLTAQISQIETLGFRGAEIIKQMMSFARKDDLEQHTVALASLLHETVNLARLSVPENIAFQFRCDDDELTIVGNTSQLQQVIINLINNARDALENTDTPRLELQLSRFHADDAFMAHHPQLKQRHLARLLVEDNGCGIPKQVITRIFDPFFTTKERGKGSGLGLAMCHTIVRQLGGIIEVESEEHKGARFLLYFPLAEPEMATKHEHAPRLFTGSGEYVLLVDDDEVVRNSFERMLTSLGYRVISAANGLEGLGSFCQHRDKIRLLITDAIMPGMNGDILACSVRELAPSLPIIFSTGYDQKQVLEDTLSLKHSRVLAKPFSLETLATSLHELLQNPPEAQSNTPSNPSNPNSAP